MKKLISIAILFIMVAMLATTIVNAATSSTLADELYALGSKYGMTSQDKVKIERYLADDPVTDAQANQVMEKAKEALKGVAKDNDCYEDLMSYYTEMLSFYEFAESPSGSFSGLESTVSSYEKNIQGYKNKLSIYID